jgi:hypothetical protein
MDNWGHIVNEADKEKKREEDIALQKEAIRVSRRGNKIQVWIWVAVTIGAVATIIGLCK